jgi:hypothetical protein
LTTVKIPESLEATKEIVVGDGNDVLFYIEEKLVLTIPSFFGQIRWGIWNSTHLILSIMEKGQTQTYKVVDIGAGTIYDGLFINTEDTEPEVIEI